KNWFGVLGLEFRVLSLMYHGNHLIIGISGSDNV
ncbi:unnamed protein product, partial [marine sediment metagenome]